MVEAVGHECMGEFFKCCDSLLAENGLIVAQTSCISDYHYDEYRYSLGFIKEYIFQGGSLPSLHWLLSSMAASSTLCMVHLEDIGRHYHLTLRTWRENLLKNKNQIFDLGFDERFIKTFEYYFDYYAAGFKSRILMNYPIIFTRPGDAAICGDPYGSLMYYSLHRNYLVAMG